MYGITLVLLFILNTFEGRLREKGGLFERGGGGGGGGLNREFTVILKHKVQDQVSHITRPWRSWR